MDAHKKMFETHGLTVTGNDEQIANYSENSHAYDYIKGAIEHLIKYDERYAGKEPTIRYAKIDGKNRLAIVNENKDEISTSGTTPTDVGRFTKLFIYNIKTKSFTDTVAVDDLISMKNDKYIEWSKYMLDAKMDNAINDELKTFLVNKYKEKVEAQKSAEQKQKRLDITKSPLGENTQSLASEKGFYVGDPAIVLRDDILNAGVRSGNVMQTGVYNVGGKRMIITHCENGRHGGHDIYSGTIGAIPLELVDGDKIKMLPLDELDIRTGNNMNIVVKLGKMYVAQSNIDEIDTREADIQDNINIEQMTI
jgi:hypothetical protein